MAEHKRTRRQLMGAVPLAFQGGARRPRIAAIVTTYHKFAQALWVERRAS
ncbi:MAG: hypothetical protein JNN08_13085 [Bryobacterales bacterium]|nr:hypothetical protein [Bryobacterales bacterium]